MQATTISATGNAVGNDCGDNLPAKISELWPVLASFLKRRCFEEAEHLVEKAARRWPAAPPIAVMKGQILVAAGRLTEARAHYERLAASKDCLPPALIQFGCILADLGDLDAAGAVLARAEEAGAPDEGQLRLRGRIAQKRGYWPEAVASFARLREITGKVDIDFQIADAYLKQGRIPDAEKVVDNIRVHSPGHPSAFRLGLDLQIAKERLCSGAGADPHRLLLAALRDEETYDRAIRREAEVWGRLFSDRTRNDRIARDTAAAASLGLEAKRPRLVDLLHASQFSPKVGLSLACGAGRAERKLLGEGVCRRFDAIDVADDSLTEARRVAAEQSFDISYGRADLNRIELPPEAYDLIVTNSCLHHVLELEHLADQIWKALRPGGILWITDYIGETRFQWSKERLDICSELFATLPPEVQWDAVNHRKIEIKRPNPYNLVSPFESIRSEEIAPIFTGRFQTVFSSSGTTILMHLARPGTREAFARTEVNRAHLERLKSFDETLLADGTLKPLQGHFLLIK